MALIIRMMAMKGGRLLPPRCKLWQGVAVGLNSEHPKRALSDS